MSQQQSDEVMEMRCLDLMRRLPPQNIRKNLSRMVPLVSREIMERLLSSVDQPFVEIKCEKTQKLFLGCDYNRDADSYRSPWSNIYQPSLDDGATPSRELRELEIQANRVFDGYRERYYDGGTASVYFWDSDQHGDFSGAILFKKGCAFDSSVRGCWDIIHVFKMKQKQASNITSATYTFVSTLMLWLETNKDGRRLDLSGSLNRQKSEDMPVSKNSSHLVNIGKMVEKIENDLRQSVTGIYFGKTQMLVTQVRLANSATEEKKKKQLHAELANSLRQRR